MALSRGKIEDLPHDAVILSEQQATFYQWKIISNWEKPREVWALRHAPNILATLAVGTGLLVNTHYRNKFRLSTYGRFSTYLPIVIIPALFTMGCHRYFVQSSVILKAMDQCPTCIQIRAAAFQIGFGVLHPTFLAPLAACFFASRHYTYRMPLITQEPLEVLKLIHKFTKPIVPKLGTVIAGHALISVYLTYKEQHEILNLRMNLAKLDKSIEE